MIGVDIYMNQHIMTLKEVDVLVLFSWHYQWYYLKFWMTPKLM